jgi:ribosomal protein S27AE
MLLMAIAQLAVRRPGWDYALNALAIRFDNVEAGRAVLYDRFKYLYADREVSSTPHYTCPRCSAVSYNPNDIDSKYCGRCHEFEDPRVARPGRARKRHRGK